MNASGRAWITTELTLLGFAYAGWLASYPLMMFLLPDYRIALIVGLFIGLGLSTFQILLRPQDLPTSPIVWLYIGLFGVLLLMSQLVGNFENLDMESVLHSGAMIAALFVIACAATPGLFQRILPIYAILVSIVLLIIYLKGDFVWGRLTAGAQPNFWGLMALSCAIAALSIERRLLKVFALGVAAIIFYASNARGSMVGAFAGMLTATAVLFFTLGTRRRIVIVAALSAVVLAAVFSELSSGFVSNELLRVDDPRRGIDSGFSGRMRPWAFGLSVALERPFFGYGYREGETLFGPTLGIDSAHNGYISMLIDTGIVGLILYLTFVGHAIIVGFRRVHRPLSFCALGFLVGYAVIGLFERYALNAGQPLSILFLMSAFYMLDPQRRRAPAGIAGASIQRIGAPAASR